MSDEDREKKLAAMSEEEREKLLEHYRKEGIYPAKGRWDMSKEEEAAKEKEHSGDVISVGLWLKEWDSPRMIREAIFSLLPAVNFFTCEEEDVKLKLLAENLRIIIIFLAQRKRNTTIERSYAVAAAGKLAVRLWERKNE